MNTFILFVYQSLSRGGGREKGNQPQFSWLIFNVKLLSFVCALFVHTFIRIFKNIHVIWVLWQTSTLTHRRFSREPKIESFQRKLKYNAWKTLQIRTGFKEARIIMMISDNNFRKKNTNTQLSFDWNYIDWTELIPNLL